MSFLVFLKYCLKDERSGMWLESVRVGFVVYGKILLLFGRMVGKLM